MTDSASSHQRSCLIISYHFPPLLGSSGVLRLLSFARALQQAGWHTTVLTCSEQAYPDSHASQQTLLPDGINVIRAWARHTVKHFSFKGRYSDLMALPDPLQSWILPAVWQGWRHIRQQQTDIILSSYPLASAQLIGYLLHRLTKKPWIADLRDPMLQDDIPHGALRRKVFGWLERKIFRYASKVLVTTAGTADFYRQRFSQYAGKLQVVANGYDEDLLPQNLPAATDHTSPLLLLHSGMLHPADRDPTALLQAVASLKQQHKLHAGNFQLVFRASQQEALLQPLLAKLDISDLVKLLPAIPYHEAIREMAQASALLLMQGETCNQQIPAKAYEYLYCQRPMLILSDAQGEVKKLHQQTNAGIWAQINQPSQIAAALLNLQQQLQQKSYKVLGTSEIQQYSRHHQAGILLELMQQINSSAMS
ncbi:glycosyltransferase [Chromatiaceae bacterium AAb-1]|nr:glycosyltransferase [Chromatiaceae bacterium AAb-1]